MSIKSTSNERAELYRLKKAEERPPPNPTVGTPAKSWDRTKEHISGKT